MRTRALLVVEGLRVYVHQGHLWRRRIVEVLHGLDFQVDEGSVTACLGPNGAGKTTTFRALCGLARHVRGRVLWRGAPLPPARLARRLGFLPELPYLYRQLTPFELLLHLGRLSRVPLSRLRERIADLAERLDFADLLHRRLAGLSKGQLQRVGLAQALLHRPELLILDEPMSGLDPVGRRLVRDVLREMRNEGVTILYSSHVLEDAEYLCDSVLAMQDGRILYAGSLSMLLGALGEWRVILKGRPPTPVHEAEVRVLGDGWYEVRGREERWPMGQALTQLVRFGEVHHAAHERMRLEDAFLRLLQEGARDA